MKDVSPELLKAIMDDFEKDLDSSSVRKQLLKVIEEGTATYKEANEYAIEVGEILAKAFQNNLSSEVLPDGHMYYNIAQKVVAEPMRNNYKLVSRACADVQTSLNRSVGLGLNGVTPDLNQDRIQGVLNLISGKEQFDDIKYMLDEPIVNFTQSVVDDSIKKNAEFQYQSGLSPKIKRTSKGKCCKWCDRLVGTYEYAAVRNTGNDVFRRHKHCRCTVEFITNGKRQNVHTKKWKKENTIVVEKINETKHKTAANLKTNFSKSSSKDREEILMKIAKNELDGNLFKKNYRYFKKRMEKGVQTPLGIIYDETDCYYHIINHHQNMMGIDYTGRIINTLENPNTIHLTKDRFGNEGIGYIEDNDKNTLLVIVRNGIITSYEPSENYLRKIKGSEVLWKKD